MAYAVPPLPYSYDDLAPTIDELTMRIHHGRHHAAYVAKLNSALEGTDCADRPAEELLADLSQVPPAKRATVRENAGGHVNHSLFWEVMSPSGGGQPAGALRDAIEAAFESVANLVRQVSEAGIGRFGSGWTWLVHDGTGLSVISTENQDCPLMNGQRPLLGIDVWEHAYYLKHQNRRADYLEAWWNVVDWEVVAERHAAVTT
jgi:Fe-Mn family superoxide dismutase